MTLTIAIVAAIGAPFLILLVRTWWAMFKLTKPERQEALDKARIERWW